MPRAGILGDGFTGGGTQQPTNKTSDSLMPTCGSPTVDLTLFIHGGAKAYSMALPNETWFHILGYLGEKDLYALSRVSRRLSVLTAKPLHDALYDPQRCKETLYWAVDNGQHDLLKKLVRCQSSVNSIAYSTTLLASRCPNCC